MCNSKKVQNMQTYARRATAQKNENCKSAPTKMIPVGKEEMDKCQNILSRNTFAVVIRCTFFCSLALYIHIFSYPSYGTIFGTHPGYLFTCVIRSNFGKTFGEQNAFFVPSFTSYLHMKIVFAEF